MKFSPVDTILRGEEENKNKNHDENHENVNKPKKARFVENLRQHLSLEELLGRSFDDAPHRLTLVAITSGIACLCDESLLDGMEEIEVVELQFAEF
jgi:hypothetical protein